MIHTSNGLFWVNGDEDPCPKQEGGLGIRSLCEMNEAPKIKWLGCLLRRMVVRGRL